jgi:small subunit ribosomal protein S13
MLNRRKDLETGKDMHINTSELKLAKKVDVDLMGEIKSYKGLRHAKGLKLRGQRTKSTGRGTSAVGVKRKNTS